MFRGLREGAHFKEGSAMEKTLSSEDLAAYREALVRKLAALRGFQNSDKEVLAGSGSSKEPEHVAKALYVAAETVSAGLITIAEQMAVQYEEALQRLGDGTYGFCEMCDQSIPKARLDAVPDTTRCVGCQRQWEREHDGIWDLGPVNLPDFDDGFAPDVAYATSLEGARLF